MVIGCPIGRRRVKARIMKLRLGQTPILLLDTDLPGATSEDRIADRGAVQGRAMHSECVSRSFLGVGGVMALKAMGERITVHHLNEGHAAFATLERIACLVEQGSRSRRRPVQKVRGHHRLHDSHASTRRSRSIRTSGGRDRDEFRVETSRNHAGEPSPILEGNVPGDRRAESLCMTVLALRSAAHVNGVAKPPRGNLQRDVAWCSSGGLRDVDRRADRLDYERYSSRNLARSSGRGVLATAHRAPTGDRPSIHGRPGARRPESIRQEAWNLRNQLRSRLVGFLREREPSDSRRARGESPSECLERRAGSSKRTHSPSASPGDSQPTSGRRSSSEIGSDWRRFSMTPSGRFRSCLPERPIPETPMDRISLGRSTA